jgi:predicted ATPase/class 3 adenylate cyclase
MASVAQPVGTVTMVFTDIEGSTRLLEELGVDAYREALAEHRRIVRAACGRHEGYEVDYEGDAFFYAFASARAAVAAVSEAMAGLEAGPIQIRVGIHTGEPELDPPKYVGMDVHRAARIMAAAHGGQVVLSPSTAALLEPGSVELKELGRHRLKDLSNPVVLHQLPVEGLPDAFPPLKTLYRSNLPVPATPFLGRQHELAEVVELLSREGIRLVTLTGPGGTGKTRLALQAAAEVSDSFPDGVWWVPLAPLRDPALLLPSIAEVLGVKEQPDREIVETLAVRLDGSRLLVLLDNAEHLLPELASKLAGLRAAAPTVVMLATSRERLQLSGEEVWPVPSLEEQEGVELFLARVRSLGGETPDGLVVRELCRRLDSLPLALELAAARTAVFSPDQLLERLGQRLDLLKGGRDADPRQQTLRATIDWSYQLLGEDEQLVFRALSVFVAGCTYEAAEHVAGADPDVLQSLLDKSLLRRRDSALGQRYWMLETISQYASELLAEDGASRPLLDRLCTEVAKDHWTQWRGLRGHNAEVTARVSLELDNHRVAVAHALDERHVVLAGQLLHGLYLFLLARGQGAEACRLAQRYLELDNEGVLPIERIPGLMAAGEALLYTGHRDRALAAKSELLAIVKANPNTAVDGSPTDWMVAAILSDFAYAALDRGDVDEANRLAEEAVEVRKSHVSSQTALGVDFGIGHALLALSEVAFARRDFQRARAIGIEAAERFGEHSEAVLVRVFLAECDLLRGHIDGGSQGLAENIDALFLLDDSTAVAFGLRVAGILAERVGASARCVTLFEIAARIEEEAGMVSRGVRRAEIEDAVLHDAEATLGDVMANTTRENAATFKPDAAVELALSLIVEIAARHPGVTINHP